MNLILNGEYDNAFIYLKKQKTDFTIKNKKGETAYDLAVKTEDRSLTYDLDPANIEDIQKP